MAHSTDTVVLTSLAAAIISAGLVSWAIYQAPDGTPFNDTDVRVAVEANRALEREQAEADRVQRACLYGPQKGGAVCPPEDGAWKTPNVVAGSLEAGYFITQEENSLRTFTFPQRGYWPKNLQLVMHYSGLFATDLGQEGTSVYEAIPLERFGSCSWGDWTLKNATFTATPDGLFLGEHNLLNVSEASLHPELDVLETDLKNVLLNLFGIENTSAVNDNVWTYTWQQVAQGTFAMVVSGQTPLQWVDAQVADNAALAERGITSPEAQALVRSLWADAKRWERNGIPLWEAVQFVVNLHKQESLKALAVQLNAVETPYWLIHREWDAPYVFTPIGDAAPCNGSNWAETSITVPFLGAVFVWRCIIIPRLAFLAQNR